MQKLAIFSVLKPHYGKQKEIQENAVRSWCELDPRPELVFFGNDVGVAEFARSVGATHIPTIVRNPYDSPRIDYILEQIDEFESADIAAFVTSDTILTSSFLLGIAAVQVSSAFVLAVRPRLLSEDQWRSIALLSRNERMDAVAPRFVPSTRVRPRPTVITYPRNLWHGHDLIPLGLGGLLWDSWLLAEALHLPAKLIDGTDYVHAFHQDHGYRDTKWGTLARHTQSPEARAEREIAEHVTEVLPLRLADLMIDSSGIVKPRDRQQQLWSRLCEQREKMKLKRSEMLVLEGMRLDNEGRSKAGLQLILKAEKLNPTYPGLGLFKAVCLMNLRRLDEAREAAVRHLSDPRFREQVMALLKLIEQTPSVPLHAHDNHAPSTDQRRH